MDTKTLCLGALMLGDASGYEIRKMFEEGVFAHFQDASLGAIYPALTRALAEGLVTRTEEAQEGRPDRKVYGLTAAGRAAFLEALAQATTPDRYRSDDCYVLYYADLLPLKRVEAVLANFQALYDTRLAQMTCSPDSTAPEERGFPEESLGQGFVRGLGAAIYETTQRYLAEEGPRLLAALARGEGRPPVKAGALTPVTDDSEDR